MRADCDRYGRTVGEVVLPDGKVLNQELVRAGLAWWYRDYAAGDLRLALLSGRRAAGRGVWSDPRAGAAVGAPEAGPGGRGEILTHYRVD